MMSPWQKEKLLHLYHYLPQIPIFAMTLRVLGQVTDHGLIMSRLTGWIVLKKQFSTFGSLATLTLYSVTSHFSAVPLNTLIFFGHPTEDLQLFCVGPGFDSISPSISSCFNLRKLRLHPLINKSYYKISQWLKGHLFWYARPLFFCRKWIITVQMYCWSAILCNGIGYRILWFNLLLVE